MTTGAETAILLELPKEGDSQPPCGLCFQENPHSESRHLACQAAGTGGLLAHVVPILCDLHVAKGAKATVWPLRRPYALHSLAGFFPEN